MKTIRFLMRLAVLPFVLASCTSVSETGDASYEPLYLNETRNEVRFVWSDPEVGWSDTMAIAPEDTAYCAPDGDDDFPHLKKNGLHWSEKDPLYDVRLVFDGEPKRCLDFTGDELADGDIRDFASYENIGKCGFCVMRMMSIPYGMLYRITEEMRASAKPCE